MRGQITVEYMVLSLVVLALLAVSVSTLIQVQRSSSEALDSVMFRKSALDLHATVEEVCALGAGNQRQAAVSRGMRVEMDGDALAFSNDTIGEMSVDLICPIDVVADNNIVYGKVIVINEGDKIRIA